MRQGFTVLLLLALGASRAHAQHFELEANRDSVKLGEVVELHARIHIGPQQNLASPVPVAAEGMPDGGRVVGVDTLEHQADRTLLLGSVRVAFLRTGRLRIPPFRVIVRATPDDRGFMLESEALYIDVVSTLPPGNPPLKDIRDQVPEQQVDPRFVLAVVAALGLLAWYARRRLARRPATVIAAPAAVAQTPADLARAALNRIEQEGWADRGDVARHYQAVAAVMREYLESIDPRVHAAQTSTELLRVLATRRSNGTPHPVIPSDAPVILSDAPVILSEAPVILSEAPVILSEAPVILSEAKDRAALPGTARIFGDADLVKFAGVLPDPKTAHAYVTRVRSVIEAWSKVGEHD